MSHNTVAPELQVVESLNVSVAAGIVLYQLRGQEKPAGQGKNEKKDKAGK